MANILLRWFFNAVAIGVTTLVLGLVFEVAGFLDALLGPPSSASSAGFSASSSTAADRR